MVEVLTTGEIILTGVSLIKKNACGKVCIARDAKEAEEKATDGCVLVVRHLSSEYNPVLGKVGAVISESEACYYGNTLTLEHDVPCVMGVRDALFTLSDGMEVTVDGPRGLIYRGCVKLVI